MSCDCCAPVAYSWHLAGYFWFTYAYNYSWYNSFVGTGFGYGSNPKVFRGHPPLLGSGGTTIPRDSDWVFLSTCFTRGYGILADGSLWGWGQGPLGDGTMDSHSRAIKISSDRWKYVSTSETHTLAIKQDGSLWGWGSNVDGYLGNGNASTQAIYSGGLFSGRALLNASIESIDTTDFQTAVSFRVYNDQSNMQPQSVSFFQNNGLTNSGATASAVIIYSITDIEYYGIAVPASSNPSITFTPDPRDVDSQSASATVVNSFGQTRVSVTSGGRYKYAPAIALTYTNASSQQATIVLKANYRSVEINATVTNGGTGYSHTKQSRILAMANIAGIERVVIGRVNLAPSSVARVEGGVTAQFTVFYKGKVTTPLLRVGGGTQGAPPVAQLISPVDGTVNLSVTLEGGGYVIPPQTFLGRQSPGFIRVTIDGNVGPIETQTLVRTNTPSEIISLDGFLGVGGNPPVPYALSGRWSVADYLGDGLFVNYMGSGIGTVLKCNSPYVEEHPPLTEEKAYFDTAKTIGEHTRYSGGPPNRPSLVSTAYGWTSTAPHFGHVGEFLSQTRTPPSVNDFDLRHSTHSPPSYPVQPTIFIKPIDGVGSGLVLSTVFTVAPNSYYNNSDNEVRYDTSFSVDNAGSGYVYEPTVEATFSVVSPTRIGPDSGWTSVLAIAGQGSAGLKSDGWPMVWGRSLNQSYSPRKVGFSLDVRSKGTAALVTKRYNRLPYQQVSSIVPDTVGTYPITQGFLIYSGSVIGYQQYEYSENLIDDSILSGDGGWRSNAAMLIRSYSNAPLYSNIPFRPIYTDWLSRYFGLSYGVYKATLPTNAATLKLFPPTGRDKYTIFIPPVYPSDLFRPIRLPMSGELNKFGACYTSAPDLGSDFSCELIAPSFCKKLSFQDGRLLATDQNNDLWFLLGESIDKKTASPVTLEPITISGLSVSATATWKWSVEEQEQQTWYGGFDGFGIPPQPTGSVNQKYMGSPTQETEVETAEYTNDIQVLPYTKWTVVVTNPGSGYKPGDVISITARGIQSAGFKNNSSFVVESVESQDVEMEQAKWTYVWTGVSGYRDRIATIAGSADPWVFTSKPPTAIYGGVVEGGYVTQVEGPETITTTVQAVKEAKFRLTDNWYPVLVDYSDRVFDNYYLDTGMYGDPRPQFTVADGGLYARTTPIVESGYLTSGTAFLNGVATATTGNGSLDVERRLLTRVPELVVTGGSGSGATAALVPLEGRDSRVRPYKITKAVTAARGTIRDATPTYAISASGSLISVKNPLVNVPASYPSNFTSFTSHVGQTSSSDLYLSTTYSQATGTGGREATELGRPTSQLNLEAVINDGGSEYQLPPVISVAQPHSDIAVVEADIDGQLIALGVEHSGSGYRYPPTLTISGGGGSGAAAEAVISGPVDAAAVTASGDGYAATPLAYLQGNGGGGSVSASMTGGVSRIEVSDGGSNYTAAPNVTIIGDGTGAAATATIKRRVSAVRIASRSGRYRAIPSVTISGGGGSGATAEAEVVYSPDSETYFVTGIRVTDKGEGYTSTASVEVSSEDGASVTAFAVMDGYVDSVTLTHSGDRYTTPPSVLLAGNASASAFLSLRLDSLSVTAGGTYRSPPAVLFEPVLTVESVTLTNPGSNYTRPPDVRIVCPSGVGGDASAKCQIGSDGKIKKIVLTARGKGYVQSAPPVVLFFGGGGSGAAATATVSAIGSGAAATTTIDGSILYARATQSGSNYQFSPSVSISGGGNEKLNTLNSDFAAGGISAEDYESRLLAIQGRIQARIEGPISRLNIINAGDRYRKPARFNDPRNNSRDILDPVSLNGIYSVGYIVGVEGGHGGVIVFNAPSDYPGGPISPPDSLPTTKFIQKPQIRFYNSVSIDVQDYRASYRTAAGMVKVESSFGPAGRGSAYYDRTGVLAYTISSGLSISGGSLTLPWSLDGEDFRIFGTGLSGFKFHEPPVFTFEGGGSGYGAIISSQLGQDGSVTGTTFTQTGSGYSIQSKLLMTRGVLRFTPCVASCTVSASGVVSSVSITDPGDGYMNPVVFIHGGGGFGASATAIRQTRSGTGYSSGTKTGGITSITLTSGGSGYSASNPPQVFVCDASGYFSDTTLGRLIAGSLNGVVNYRRSVEWSGEQSEYARPMPHEFMSDHVHYDNPWFGSSGEYFSYYGGGLTVGKEHSFPAVDAGSEYVRFFGYADTVTNVFIGCDTTLMKRPYSSPPQISVAGACKRQMSLSSTLAKWGSVISVSGTVVSAIRTDR